MLKFCLSPIVRQYIVILTANLSMICLGLSLAWTSPMLSKLKEGAGTGIPSVTDEEGSWVVSIGLLSGLPMHLIIGPIMDKIGRKTCLILASVIRFAGCLMLLLAPGIWMVLLARAIIDIVTLSMVITVTASYTSEIASKEIRGALATLSHIATAVGMLIFFGIAPFLSYFYVNVLFTCIVGAICIPTIFLPETPYYLYSKGHKEESMKILIKYRGSKILAYEEMEEYDLSLKNAIKRPGIIEIFKDPITLKTFGKVLILGILFEFTGYNAMTLYMMEILKSTNTSVSSNIASLANGIIQVLGCFFTILLTDRFGRKPILIGTLVGMTLGMIGLGTFFYLRLQGYEITGYLNYIPIISIMLYTFCFSAGLGSLCWILIAELFEGSARGTALSFTIFLAVTIMFCGTKYFTAIMNYVGPAIVYWCISINCLVTALYIMFAFPETKEKSYSQIQRELGRNVGSKIEVLT